MNLNIKNQGVPVPSTSTPKPAPSSLLRPGNQAGNNDPAAFVEAEKKRIQEGIVALKEELMDSWKKRHSGEPIFPEEVAKANPLAVGFLLSFELVEVYEEIAKESGLDKNKKDVVPQFIWQAFLKGKLDGVEEKLAEGLELKDASKETFLKSVREKVIARIKEYNSKSFAPSENKNIIAKPNQEQINQATKMTLRLAIERNKNVGEQLLTSTPLKLRVFPEPVRPSLKNWIVDYNDHLGSGKHGTIERGNFLFHSENAKKLSSTERVKLAEVLKAFDDGVEISIDVDKGKIIFE